MYRMIKKRNTNKKALILLIISTIIFIILSFIVLYLKNTIDNTNVTKIIMDEKITDSSLNEKEKTELILDLKEKNDDIIGWLKIPDTDISYPVLQSNDNQYYMTHDYQKKYSKDGSIFLDKNYNFEIPSSNLLLYGHNNKNGKMFNQLLEYKNEKFYKQHPIIEFVTEKEDAEYEIISAFLSRVYYTNEKNVFRYYFFIDAKNEEDFNYYINNSKKEALYDTGKTAKYGDQLLTLSTCSYHTEDGRFAIVARKISK